MSHVFGLRASVNSSRLCASAAHLCSEPILKACKRCVMHSTLIMTILLLYSIDQHHHTHPHGLATCKCLLTVCNSTSNASQALQLAQNNQLEPERWCGQQMKMSSLMCYFSKTDLLCCLVNIWRRCSSLHFVLCGIVSLKWVWVQGAARGDVSRQYHESLQWGEGQFAHH